ncbi:jg9664 [Pararge aegeria aegeria]|uniref:Jg9664 protein n=1 Tax=Pararge aegeria aegeria TaxID=348720 RepID=A0A8S4RRJ5_9NEOP|nr:jg9664 [Pararge aegeria aegeria]
MPNQIIKLNQLYSGARDRRGVAVSSLCRACIVSAEKHVVLEYTGVAEKREVHLGSPAFPEVLGNLERVMLAGVASYNSGEVRRSG